MITPNIAENRYPCQVDRTFLSEAGQFTIRVNLNREPARMAVAAIDAALYLIPIPCRFIPGFRPEYRSPRPLSPTCAQPQPEARAGLEGYAAGHNQFRLDEMDGICIPASLSASSLSPDHAPPALPAHRPSRSDKTCRSAASAAI
jgi:hypothetical protein